MNRCIICDKPRPPKDFWLCKNCAVEWGCFKVKYKNWPNWIKELIRMEDRRIKRESKYGKEVPLAPEHIEVIIESRP